MQSRIVLETGPLLEVVRVIADLHGRRRIGVVPGISPRRLGRHVPERLSHSSHVNE